MGISSASASAGKPVGCAAPDAGENPRLLIGGLPPEKFQYGLDWLRYSAASSIPLENLFYKHKALHVTDEQLPPLRGYNTSIALSFGRVDWHTDRPQQKQGVQFSGSDLEQLTDKGIQHIDLMTHAVVLPACRFTRLDFAVDIFADNASPRDIVDCIRRGAFGSYARTYTVVDSRGTDGNSRGCTVYVGSRKSSKFLRVYDKAAQLGQHDRNWIRVELEAKHEYAHMLASSMVLNGIIPSGKQALRDFVVNSDVNWLNEALYSDSEVYIRPVGRKLTSTHRWLMDVVLPLINRELSAGDYPQLYNALWHILYEHRKHYTGGFL